MFKVLSCGFISALAMETDYVQLLQTRTKVVLLDDVDSFQEPEDFCTDTKLELNPPVVNDLAGQGIVRYPNVKDGVDLILQAGEGYTVHKPKFNGLYKGFGNINMMSGTRTEFAFKFVKAGTEEPVEMPKVSITWYDLDEGHEGRSRGSLETCGAARSFLPATTELSQVTGGNGCFKTSSCMYGRKGNSPQSPDVVNADAFKRTLTYSYSAKSEFKVKISSEEGFNGRNYYFTLDPLNACKMTTTSTTTTTGAQPVCGMPNGGHTICNMRQDPYADRVFAGSAGFVRPLGIMRAAKSRDGAIEIQTFHCPYTNVDNAIAIVCGVAVKMGNTVVKYLPGKFIHPNDVYVTVNGGLKSVTDSERTTDASILPAPVAQNQLLQPYSNEGEIVCISDNNRTATISIGQRKWTPGVNFLEFDWKLFMNNDIIDFEGPNMCGKGTAVDMEQMRIAFHDFETNLFSAKEVDFLCTNYMGSGKCNNWQENIQHNVATNQDLCEETGTDYAKAFSACQGFANPKVEAACVFEYCQDGGEGKPRAAAKEGEEILEEDDLEAAVSHQRDFVPEECCPDDPDCDKNIGMAM